MITRTFLDKSTTIKCGSLDNFGLNPISMLGYGFGVYRSLVHFDVSKVKALVDDHTYYDINNLRHVLKMKNCGSIDNKNFKKNISCSDSCGVMNRATSFDIIAFKVNKLWDEGVGFDNTNDFWQVGKTAVSQYGATWYNATTDTKWDCEGVFTNSYIFDEYEKYLSGSGNTIIVGAQHFDYGNEDLEIDVTDYVNSLILNNEENYGLCLTFLQSVEELKMKQTQYVGFFNNKTNTIYEPVLESVYNCVIDDNRYDFVEGKNNNLFLYSYIGGELKDLDNMPVCNVDGVNYPVNQFSKGVYYITVNTVEGTGKIKYDTWSNLVYDGVGIDDAELEFVSHNKGIHFGIGERAQMPKVLNPIISGMNDNEVLNKGEIRTIKLYFKVPYTNDDYRLVKDCWYRIYVKDGDREVTIIDWDGIHKMGMSNLFNIKANELVPSEYHVDIKARFGDDIKIFKNELAFKIANVITDEKY